MKLRNKKTGEINILKVDEDYFKIYKDDGEFVCPVTLKELNNGWEDYYDEPKEYWYIDDAGVIQIDQVLASEINMRKSIGNYFESKTEAVKAVEKLKAWKRLKDKGFRFGHWVTVTEKKCGKVEFKCDDIRLSFDEARKFYDDITLLFGGEQ